MQLSNFLAYTSKTDSVKNLVKNSENSAHQKVSIVKLPTRVSGKQLFDAFLFT